MRNRRYETVFILPPDLEEGKRKEILDRLDGVVEKGGGIRVKREDWGVRRLAFTVNRHPKGNYYLLDYVGSAQVVAELERHLRMFENVLRFLTVKTDDRVDPETAKKEQAEEREKEEAREAERRESERREAERRQAEATLEASAEDEPDSSEEVPAEDEAGEAVSSDTGGEEEEGGEEEGDATEPVAEEEDEEDKPEG